MVTDKGMSMPMKIQQTCGTLERNKAIYEMWKGGMKQIAIARLFSVNGHPMTPQQVNKIIQRSKRDGTDSTGRTTSDDRLATES